VLVNLSLWLVDLLEIEKTSSGEGRAKCDINRFKIGEVSLANAAANSNHSDRDCHNTWSYGGISYSIFMCLNKNAYLPSDVTVAVHICTTVHTHTDTTYKPRTHFSSKLPRHNLYTCGITLILRFKISNRDKFKFVLSKQYLSIKIVSICTIFLQLFPSSTT